MAIYRNNKELQQFTFDGNTVKQVFQGTNELYNILKPVPPTPLLLDDYPDAAGAWSTRRLSLDYTGPLMEVRRSTDNATLDIGYDSNNELDTAALDTFLGANDGYVSTFYDQSGNGVDFTQTTGTRQPLIYSNGTYTRGTNGKPSLRFVADVMEATYGAATDSYGSIFIVSNPDSTGTLNVPYAQSSTKTSAPAWGLIDHSDGRFKDFMWAAGQEAIYNPNTTNLAVRTAIRRASPSPQNAVYIDGVIGGTTTTATDANIGVNASLGCIFIDNNGGGGTFPLTGYISELVVWRSDQTSNISGIQGDMAAYFGP